MRRAALILTAAVLAVSCTHSTPADIQLEGIWHTNIGDCTLPGTTDESLLGDRYSDSTCTQHLTREYSYKGAVTYSKDVTIPEGLEGRRLRLIMERTKPSTLAVDGDTLGSIGNLIASHVYELPKLEPGNHRFDITIDNSDSAVPREVHGSHAWTEQTQTDWNGILGDFRIESRDSTFISGLRIETTATKAVVAVSVTAHKNSAFKLFFKASCGSSAAGNTLIGDLVKGDNVLYADLEFGDSARPWSEFHPDLYDLEVSLKAGNCSDITNTRFGLRSFEARGTQFAVNGLTTFLRGKHDGCVFPLSAHVPADIKAWRSYFSKVKSMGINHVRFHSYTPTEAAFAAADEAGVYLQVELPFWGSVDRARPEADAFYRHEGLSILRQFGNHPSFVMMGLGNELTGDPGLMREWVEEFRAARPDKLYCCGSNNWVGWKGPLEGEDYHVAAKIGGCETTESHIRGSFCFCDAWHGGILNTTRPGTAFDYSGAINGMQIPAVGHEIGQYQVYPDYGEISKYTGVLRPFNLELFRSRMLATFGSDRSEEFQHVTGDWALECYKAEMEAALRTPGFGGFELLDLQDFSGQGSALVGMLDAFMDDKNIEDLQPRWAASCAPLVALARFRDYSLWCDDELNVDFQIANYLESGWDEPLSVRISAHAGHEDALLYENEFSCDIDQGTLCGVGSITFPLRESVPQDTFCTLTLDLRTGRYSNSYTLYVFPHGEVCEDNIFRSEGPELSAALRNGETAVLIRPGDTGGLFIPEFWNWIMFRDISINAGAEVSPGTLSVLVEHDSEFATLFPTGESTGWQWWSILVNSHPATLRKGDTPLVEMIDNFQRSLPLAVLYETPVESGRLIICTTDIDAIAGTPEGDAYRSALARICGK